METVSNEALLVEATAAVKRGELVAFPTDTVYGIGCDPYNDDAVVQLFLVKKRQRSKSISLLVDSVETAQSLGEFPQYCRELLEQHWPGALTVIVQKKKGSGLSKELSRDETIALRMPRHKELLEFVTRVGGALAASSANLSGRSPLLTYDEVYAAFSQKVSLVLPGSVQHGVSSTVVDCTAAKPVLVRQGPLFL